MRVFAATCACLVCLQLGGGAGASAGMHAARLSAVSWAVHHIGLQETAGTNCSVQINRWERAMGLKVPPCRPWCGAFVHQAFLQAGVRLSARLIDPDRTYSDVVAGRRGLRRIAVSQVRPGDLLFYAIRPGLRASHVEIVRSNPHGGKVLAVGGNVSNAVRSKLRSLRLPVLAARVVG